MTGNGRPIMSQILSQILTIQIKELSADEMKLNLGGKGKVQTGKGGSLRANIQMEKERRVSSHVYTGKDILQSSSSRDDFNQFLGDHSLASAVEGQSQLVNHLSCKGGKKQNKNYIHTHK